MVVYHYSKEGVTISSAFLPLFNYFFSFLFLQHSFMVCFFENDSHPSHSFILCVMRNRTEKKKIIIIFPWAPQTSSLFPIVYTAKLCRRHHCTYTYTRLSLFLSRLPSCHHHYLLCLVLVSRSGRPFLYGSFLVSFFPAPFHPLIPAYVLLCFLQVHTYIHTYLACSRISSFLFFLFFF